MRELYQVFYHEGYRYLFMREENEKDIIYCFEADMNFDAPRTFFEKADGSEIKDAILRSHLESRIQRLMNVFEYTKKSMAAELKIDYKSFVYDQLNDKETIETLADYFQVSPYTIIRWMRTDSRVPLYERINRPEGYRFVKEKGKKLLDHAVISNFIINYYQEMTDSQMVEELEKYFGIKTSRATVSRWRNENGLGIRNNKISRVSFDRKEISDYIKKNYLEKTDREMLDYIKEKFGIKRTVKSIADWRMENGLTKNRRRK